VEDKDISRKPGMTMVELIRTNQEKTIEEWTPFRELSKYEQAVGINYAERHKKSERHAIATTTRVVEEIKGYQVAVVNQVKRLKIIENANYKAVRDIQIGPPGRPSEGPKKLKDIILNASMYIYMEGKEDALNEVEASLGRKLNFDIMDVTPAEALKRFKGKIPMTKREFGILIAREKAKAFSLAGIIEKDMLRDVQLLLFRAMEQGWTIDQFYEALQKSEVKYTGTAYGSVKTGQPITPVHAETMIRTNFAEVYSLGREATFNDKDVIKFVPAFEYSAILDGRERKTHGDMDGKIYLRGDPIWLEWTPPNGFNCRCIKIPVTINMDYAVSSRTALKSDSGFGSIASLVEQGLIAA